MKLGVLQTAICLFPLLFALQISPVCWRDGLSRPQDAGLRRFCAPGRARLGRPEYLPYSAKSAIRYYAFVMYNLPSGLAPEFQRTPEIRRRFPIFWGVRIRSAFAREAVNRRRIGRLEFWVGRALRRILAD